MRYFYGVFYGAELFDGVMFIGLLAGFRPRLSPEVEQQVLDILLEWVAYNSISLYFI